MGGWRPQRPLIQGDVLIIIVLILIALLKEGPTYCYSHFIDEKTERGCETGPRSHSFPGIKVGREPKVVP